MNDIKLNRAYLKIMLRVAAKKDVRAYLTTVLFVGGEGKVLAYAADGHQLIRWIVADDYKGPDFKHTVRRSCIENALRSKLAVSMDIDTGQLKLADRAVVSVIQHPLSLIIYPSIESLTVQYAMNENKDQLETVLISSEYLINLGKIGKILAKENKMKAVPIRFYQRQGTSKIANTFTFNGCSDLIYFVAGQRHEGVTDEEEHAVKLDAHLIPDNPLHAKLDKGESVLCGVSNADPRATQDPRGMVVTIVSYGIKGYEDKGGNHWTHASIFDKEKSKSTYKKG